MKRTRNTTRSTTQLNAKEALAAIGASKWQRNASAENGDYPPSTPSSTSTSSGAPTKSASPTPKRSAASRTVVSRALTGVLRRARKSSKRRSIRLPDSAARRPLPSLPPQQVTVTPPFMRQWREVSPLSIACEMYGLSETDWQAIKWNHATTAVAAKSLIFQHMRNAGLTFERIGELVDLDRATVIGGVKRLSDGGAA